MMRLDCALALLVLCGCGSQPEDVREDELQYEQADPFAPSVQTRRARAAESTEAVRRLALEGTSGSAPGRGMGQETGQETGQGSGASSVELSPADGPLLDQLMAHVDEANALQRTPFIYVHANWCGPCIALDRYADDPSMAAAFAGTHIARVDQDLWHEQLAPFGLNRSIPAWVDLDAHGLPGSRRIGGGAWGDNVPANMAGPLSEYFGAR